MLKDKYSIKLAPAELHDLSGALDTLYMDFGRTTLTTNLEILQLACLKQLKKRVNTALVFPKKKNTVNLQQHEALAIYFAHKIGLFRFNPTVAMIATEVHKTL